MPNTQGEKKPGGYGTAKGGTQAGWVPDYHLVGLWA